MSTRSREIDILNRSPFYLLTISFFIFGVSLAGVACDSGGASSNTTENKLSFEPFRAGLEDVNRGSTSMADVNGDSNLDLLLTGETDEGSTTRLYLGDGTGSFQTADIGLPGVSTSSSLIADVDKDGNSDIVLSGDARGGEITRVYLGDGQGGFSQANAGLDGVRYSATAFGDVNNDNHPDLLVTGHDPAKSKAVSTLYLGDGKGGFQKSGAELAGLQNGTADIKDIDGDGNPDLFITGTDGVQNRASVLYLGDGNGGFSKANAEFAGVRNSAVSIWDTNDDQTLDIFLTGTQDEQLANLYLGTGNGGFRKAESKWLFGTEYGSSSIADFDEDRDTDFLLTGLKEPGSVASIFLKEDEGAFTGASTEMTEVWQSSSSVGDVDNDGDIDLLVTGETSDDTPSTTVYENQLN